MSAEIGPKPVEVGRDRAKIVRFPPVPATCSPESTKRCSESARFDTIVGQTWHKIGQIWAELDEGRPLVARHRPTSVRLRLTQVRPGLARNRPKLARRQPNLGRFDLTWPEFDGIWPTGTARNENMMSERLLSNTQHKSSGSRSQSTIAKLRSELVELGEFRRIRCNFGRARPNFGRTRRVWAKTGASAI